MSGDVSGPPPVTPEGGLWLSVADLARHKGITRQSASERVKRLVTAGKLTLRAEGRKRLVNLAAYDTAVGEVGDAAKEAGVETKAAAVTPAPTTPKFRDAQTREKEYAADLKFIEREKQLGNLVPLADVLAAADDLGSAFVEIKAMLVPHTEDLTATAVREGEHGMRRALKVIEDKQCRAFANALRDLAAASRAAAARAAGAAPRFDVQTELPITPREA